MFVCLPLIVYLLWLFVYSVYMSVWLFVCLLLTVCFFWVFVCSPLTVYLLWLFVYCDCLSLTACLFVYCDFDCLFTLTICLFTLMFILTVCLLRLFVNSHCLFIYSDCLFVYSDFDCMFVYSVCLLRLFVYSAESQDSGYLYFCFRWLLIRFKREFSFQDILRFWEVSLLFHGHMLCYISHRQVWTSYLI